MLELLEEIHILLHEKLILKCEMTNSLPFIMLILHWHNPELTAGNRVLLESLIFAQLMKKPMAFYCIWRLVLFVRSCARSLYWARVVQSIPSHPFYSNHFNIGLPRENCRVGAQSTEWLSCLDHYGTRVWCSKCQTLPVVDSQFFYSSSIFFPSSLLSVSSSSSSSSCTIQAG